ncbi:MAG: hypothetical protein R2698_03280 [Microthrixaceae bacterium]
MGGMLAGGLAGVAAALVLAQVSSKVLDDVNVAQVLGTPVVGSFPRDRALLRDPRNALVQTPAGSLETLDRLTVRAEAMADPDVDHALTIAVVGTQPLSGVTTLSLALARRLAQTGYSVVVVDGDVRTQGLSDLFTKGAGTGIGALLSDDWDEDRDALFTPTNVANVEILGVGSLERRAALRRDAIGPILGEARRRAQVVVYDGGHLMGSALTLFAGKASDVMVVAVPLADQEQEVLEEVAEYLPADRSRVLAVATDPVRRRASRLDEGSTADTAPVERTTEARATPTKATAKKPASKVGSRA